MLLGKKVLIIDDEAELCSLMKVILSMDGSHVTSVCTLADAAGEREKQFFDVILTDVHLPDGNGVEFIHQIKCSLGGEAPAIIVISGFSHFTEEEILLHGADEFILKPFDLEALRFAVRNALTKATERRKAS